jgi:hypothetical protein
MGWTTEIHCLTGAMAGYFLFAITSIPPLGPTQPPIQRVLGDLSLGENRLGREADHSPPSGAKIKNAWSYISTLPVHFHGMVLS